MQRNAYISVSIHDNFIIILSELGLILEEIVQNDVEEMEADILHEQEAYTQLKSEVILSPTNEQEGMFIYYFNFNGKAFLTDIKMRRNVYKGKLLTPK